MFFKPKDNILFKSCNVVNSTYEAPHARETALSIAMHSAQRQWLRNKHSSGSSCKNPQNMLVAHLRTRSRTSTRWTALVVMQCNVQHLHPKLSLSYLSKKATFNTSFHCLS